jgi:hypothetical protein
VSPAARAWRALCAAAAAAGHVLKATSYGDSYRWYDLQYEIFHKRYSTSPVDGYIATRTCGGVLYYQRPGTAMAACPGTSNHGWGLAVDTGEEIDHDAGTESLDAETLAWLVVNARRFGFWWEVQSEPWHIRYCTGDAIPAAVLAFEQGGGGVIMGTFEDVWNTDGITNPYADKATNPTIQAETALHNIARDSMLTVARVGTPTEIWSVNAGASASPVRVIDRLNQAARDAAAAAAGVTALTVVVERLAAAVIAGGGSVDTGAILAGVDVRLAALQAELEAETRDAVADLGELGAAGVRADA